MIALLGFAAYLLFQNFRFTELQLAVTLLTCVSLLYVFFFYHESIWLVELSTGIPALFLPAIFLAAIEFFKIFYLSPHGISLLCQVSGVGLAIPLMILFHKWKPLPAGMTFPYENNLRAQVSEREINEALLVGMKWLQLNPGSQLAAIQLLAKLATPKLHNLPKLQHQIQGVRAWFLSVGQWRFRKDPLVLDSAPLEWFVAPIEKNKIAQTLKISKALLEAQHLRAAWVLQFQVLQSEPTSERADLFKAWMNLTEKLMKDAKFLQDLQEAGSANRNFSEVLASYGIWLGQSRSEY